MVRMKSLLDKSRLSSIRNATKVCLTKSSSFSLLNPGSLVSELIHLIISFLTTSLLLVMCKHSDKKRKVVSRLAELVSSSLCLRESASLENGWKRVRQEKQWLKYSSWVNY